VTIEGLDASKDLAVVSAGDQDLCARADGGLEDGEGSSGELVLLDLGDFVFAVIVSSLLETMAADYVLTSIPIVALQEAPCDMLADTDWDWRECAYWIFASTMLAMCEV
jgi:hypothetical protein